MWINRLVAKHLLIFFNVVFLVIAVSLILMGGMMLLKIYNWEGVVENTIPTFVVILGCLIFIFAFIGFWGAIEEDSCLTLIYSIFMLTLLTLEFLFLFYTYYDKDKLVKISEGSLQKAWKLQKEGKPGLMNVIQMGVPCCGIEGDSDYKGRSIPKSCYKNYKRGINSKQPRQGCKKALKSFIYSKSNGFQYIIFAIIAFQVLIFAWSCSVSGYGSPTQTDFTNFMKTDNFYV